MRRGCWRGADDPAGDLEGALEHRRRRVDQDRGNGADDDDDEGSRRPQRRKTGALEDASANQRGNRQQQANQTEFVHAADIGSDSGDLR